MQINAHNLDINTSSSNNTEGKVRLGDYVDVLRLQGIRFPLDEDTCLPGKLPDGRFFCREITLSCFGIRTGFVDVAYGRPVMMQELTDNQTKHFLQENDILCTHVGMPDAIGKVGLVINADEDAVVARSLCILRPKGIDPIWLYYFLREPGAWDEAITNSRLKKAEYNKKFTSMKDQGKQGQFFRPSTVQHLTMSDIQDIWFYMPSDRDIQTINTLHETILAQTNKIQDICKEMDQDLLRAHSVIMLSGRNMNQIFDSSERFARKRRN